MSINTRSLILTVPGLLAILTGCSGTPQQREAAHMQKGKQFVAQKNLKKAVIEFKVASQNMPKDPEPLYALGMAYLSGGAPKTAIESFEKVLALNPKHEGAKYQMALFQLGTNKMEMLHQAKDTISAWTQTHPNDGEAFASLGLANAKLGDKAEALRLLEIGEAKDSAATLRIASSVIALYAARGDIDSAKEVARDLADKLPNSPEAAVLRAQVSLATKDIADADAEISRALSLKKDFKPALQLRLRRELMSGDTGNAEATTKEMAQLPEKRMWGAYARILFSEKKFDQGIAEYERQLKAHDNDSELRDDYAGTLIQAGKRTEAEAIVNGTLSSKPKDVPALLMRASLEIDRNALEQAAKDVQTLQELKAFSAQLSFQESRIFAARGDTVKEGDQLADVLKRDPRILLARLEMSRLLIAANKAKNALIILDQAPSAQKNSAQFVFYHNMALISAGQYDDARKEVDRALKVVKSPGFLFQDAVLKIHNKDIAGARKSLDAAFALAPADPATLNLLRDVMSQQKEYPAYVQMVKDAAAKNKNSPVLQTAVGNILESQGDSAGARAAFEAVKTSDPVNGEVDLALLDLKSGAVDKAHQRLLNLVKDHDNLRARIMLAEIEMKTGPADGPVQQYLKALKLEPNNVLAMNNLAGYLSIKQKKYEDALFWGQKALALAPNSPIVEDTVGWTYYLEGRYDQALPYMEKSVRAQDRAVGHYHLAAVLLKAGDHARGQHEYELAVKQDPNSPEKPEVDKLLKN